MARTIFSFEVTPGMVIAKDVHNLAGQLILPKGFVLDVSTIAKLEFYGILEVPVEDAPANIDSISDDDPSVATPLYSQKLKESVEFKEFKAHYEAAINAVTNTLPKIIKKEISVDSNSLYEDITNIIGTSKNTMHLFDIIHNLRDQENIISSHSVNVSVIANIFGRWLGFSEADIRTLTLAGLLHDVGMFAIPGIVIYKPDKLTEAEYALVQQHVKVSYEILRPHDIDQRIKEACLMHHERCDGTGYPFKLTSERIPAFAKIIAIADVYDAMTATRSYREAICPFDVIAMFDKEGLTKFDPYYIMTFLNQISSSYLHSNVRLSDGRVGEIVMINQMCLYKPVVKVGNEFVDLLRNSSIKIEALL